MDINSDKVFYLIKKNNDNYLEYSVDKCAYILNIKLSPIKTLRFLLSIIIFLAVASLISNLARLYLPDFPLKDSLGNLFDVNRELNIPSLYSTFLLLLCSGLLTIVGSIKIMQRDRYRFQWLGLSCIFFFLGMDELIVIHETLTYPVSFLVKREGFLYYTWVIPGFIFALVCLVIFWNFLTHLPKKTRNLFLIAGSIYIFGAVALEMLGGYIADIYGEGHILWILEIALEEFCEMLGIATFYYALTTYISHDIRGVTCRVDITEK
ncbi:hypothetical protein [Calothrix sp. PCC 6303]|uniref:hypothetical protein n=1 Tax=Calothrix sp. PCC 6303 TaxID=1170562 RepID=UPI0002A038F5|nr:hypothetical protein [Calothrix sp. PCC 6303]AFZ02407.1 hypothetical protein Cal6303_3474 [Calothrix sp. PCC 6303]